MNSVRISYKIIIILISIFIGFQRANSQDLYPFSKGWSIGFNLGTSYFYGDASDGKNRLWNNTPFSKYYYEDRNIMLSFTGSKDFNEFFGLRGNLLWGKFNGKSEKIGVYTNGNVQEISIEAYANILDIVRYKRNRKYSFYAFGGLGLSSFRTNLYSLINDSLLQTFGYSANGKDVTSRTTEAMLSLGLGFRYYINPKASLNFETSLRNVFTDKLDALMIDKANLEGYGFMSVGFTYHFDFKIRKRNKSFLDPDGRTNKRSNGINNNRKKKLKNKWQKRF